MLNPADARSLFPPLFLGLLRRAVWSSVSTYFRMTRKTLYMRKIGKNEDFAHSLLKILKSCHRLRFVEVF